MSSFKNRKTSSRKNTQKHKGHTRKNGGVKFEDQLPKVRKQLGLELFVKYFYKGRPCMSLPVKHLNMSFEEMAQKTIREYLEKGKNIKEIIDIFTKNLEKKNAMILKLEFMEALGVHTLQHLVTGISSGHFLIDWNNSIAVLIKLKALKNDDQNGKLSYYSTQAIEDGRKKF